MYLRIAINSTTTDVIYAPINVKNICIVESEKGIPSICDLIIQNPVKIIMIATSKIVIIEMLPWQSAFW